MNQHISSMLEHLQSLRRKNSTQSENDNRDEDHNKDVNNDVYKMTGKSKNSSSSIFKTLISDNGATNIFSNLIKCPDMNLNSPSASAATTKITVSSSSLLVGTANKTSSDNNNQQHQQQQQQKHEDDNNNQKSNQLNVLSGINGTSSTSDVNVNISSIGVGGSPMSRKRNSVVKSNGGELNSYREFVSIPSNRVHRKSCHDIRLMRNNHLVTDSGDEVGKVTAVKPLKTRNIITKNETFDILHPNAMNSLGCSSQVCMGSVMIGNVFPNEKRKSEVVHEHAKDFLNQYYTSIRRLNSPAHEARWKQIEQEIQQTGVYQLNDLELIFGAKTAWRNSARCIGRIQWSKLQVFDCRQLSTPSQMFEALCNHLKYSTNKGNLRSAITIFPQRTDPKHDFRIWNSQLVSYAGYQTPDGTIIGDPVNVEITEVCLKLGWKPPRTEFDILPLVLSANGHDPELFEYPADLVLEVPLIHPEYKWFGEMNLKWYAVPAVSGMLFDCGGIIFPCCAFSGWYMSTEIGCRNLCDTNRRNLLEPIAIKMGLDVRNPSSLWKDKALVEVNIAVLHSYQRQNVTIVDHHTASESFMKHYENESKLRKGCPADWVWIVPPMSASVMQVFHQEMAVYYLRPSFEYQETPMKTHVWKKNRESDGKNKKPRRKFHFKQIARAVKFTSKLFGRALSRRIKATVLYATETGRSEQYAKQLVELLSHAFNAQIYNMADYDISSIEHEALLFFIASTFGNGDPPENGEQFAQDLYAIKMQESELGNRSNFGNQVTASTKSFIKASSRINVDRKKSVPKIDRIDSLTSQRGSCSDSLFHETFGPLSNVRYAVFALGSSAYPNFCSFGKFLDNILGELGGERLNKIVLGDDLCGQEQEFRKWAYEIFKKSCETFCLDINDMSEASMSFSNATLTKENTRFQEVEHDDEDLSKKLSKYHNKNVRAGRVKNKPINLHGVASSERSTVLVELLIDSTLKYEPGDHVGVCPMNRDELVDGIIEKLSGVADPNEPLQLQILNEKHTSNGITRTWENHEKIPTCSLKTLLTRFMDITSPPSRQFLTFLSSYCENDDERQRMEKLSTESEAYEDWKHDKLPHILEVFDEFPSCRPPVALFIANLTPLQPRFYSISSSQRKHPEEVHLTVATVKYKTNDGRSSPRYGVCSNYLEGLNANDEIQIFLRSASSFHLPKNTSHPIILIGPGTGTAPFRSFWQELDEIKSQNASFTVPKVWLFFGCRTESLDLYRTEKMMMIEKGILDKAFLALSREVNIPKTYVQDLIMKESDEIYNLIKHQNAHIYVCGDVQMAENVYQTLRKIVAIVEEKTESLAEKYMLQLKDESRYHEDIFGITLRTQEIHNRSRETAKIKMDISSK